jgi:tetratricopeptide (TPR) repeat protein
MVAVGILRRSQEEPKMIEPTSSSSGADERGEPSYHHSFTHHQPKSPPGRVLDRPSDVNAAECEDDDEGTKDGPEDDVFEGESSSLSTSIFLPRESELALLCLDYLRDVRRAAAAAGDGEDERGSSPSTGAANHNHPPNHQTNESDDAVGSNNVDGRGWLQLDYLTIAVWALQRAFLQPPLRASNDPCADLVPPPTTASDSCSSSALLAPPLPLPTVAEMEGEVLDEHGQYEHDDSHPSNTYRFYRLHGMASFGDAFPAGRDGGPISLGEIVSAGLSGLEARSRHQAERELCDSVLFRQFVAAVTERGFFASSSSSSTSPFATNASNKEAESGSSSKYEEKFRKVVAKFRTKLAHKGADAGAAGPAAASTFAGDLVALSASERYFASRQRLRQEKVLGKQVPHQMTKEATAVLLPAAPSPGNLGAFFPPSTTSAKDSSTRFFGGPSSPPPAAQEARDSDDGATPAASASVAAEKEASSASALSSPSPSHQENPADVAHAETLKNQGNAYMQQREFEKAADCYTRALQLSPVGPHSHVYYSNRAAALVSMKQFDAAIADSQRSLALRPDYGKAHARLGLAHFLLGNYHSAVEAYTESLRYQPDNRSSRNYLEKATRRLAEQQLEEARQSAMSTSAVSASATIGSSNHLSSAPKKPKDATGTSLHPARKGATALHPEPHRVDPDPVVPSVGNNSRGSEPAIHEQLQQQQQAEKYKSRGNQFMVQRDYDNAYRAYTRAIELSPSGPHSHVYYSNRAAALCYLERYQEAEQDSLSSLRLVPGYGKAHARLGLSRFFVGNYEGAVSSYRLALQHDPDNAASKSYLLKAQAKLEQQQQRR